MDWNMKPPPSWDFTELGQEQFSNFDTVNVSHSFGDHKLGREDFSVDLKLGRVGNSGKEPSLEKPSGSSKRSRGSNNASQSVSCLVDGCKMDLSGCRDYHRRHKVCELHSKTPQVTIAGHKQRFCQQCSRFHSLEAFDEGKRSCRKRLDGHNRRRRKPQPEPFTRYGSLLSNYTGGQLWRPQVYPSTTVGSPSWVVNTEVSFPVMNSNVIYEGPRQLQSSDCALSLLSSPSPHTNETMLPLIFHASTNQQDSHQTLPSHCP